MLVSIVFPIHDYRELIDPSFDRIIVDKWDTPHWPKAHMRGFGRFERRPKCGFEDWVGERYLVYGNNRLRLKLFRKYDECEVDKVNLIRKACFFDGLANGRFEFLFSVNHRGKADYAKIAKTFLSIPASTRDGRFEGPLSLATSPLRYLFATATVERENDARVGQVTVGDPMCIIEDEFADVQYFDSRFRVVPKAMSVSNLGKSHSVFALLSNRPTQGTLRSGSRYIRTYMVRLLQDIATIGDIVGGTHDIDLESDFCQATLRQYFKHINRADQRLNDRHAGELVEYSFTAFEALHPGAIEQAYKRLSKARMRRQVKNNILGVVERANQAVSYNFHAEVIQMGDGDNVAGNKTGGDHIEGNKVAGDAVDGNKIDRNIEGVTVNQSSGVNFGDNATVNATQVIQNAELVSGLKELAKKVREVPDQDDPEMDAALIEKAAEALSEGDDEKAKSRLQKCGEWVLDLAGKVGSTALLAWLAAKGLM